MQRSKGSLFHQLVGERKQIRRDIEAERFGGCEVDDEIDLACQLNRHIGGCRPFENPASVDPGTTIGIGLARSVAHKDAGLGEAAKGSARRQRVAAPGLSARPYFNRYTDDAIDLCDVLSSFAPQAKATLHEICKVMGLSGKPAGIHGGEVARYCLEGKIKEVADYCETDIVNTYRVWLRYELFRGRLTNEVFATSEANLVEFIKLRGNTKPHLIDLTQ
jgi:hypothetical protein